MGLATGRRLGSYEIVGPIGAGGMGEVYRARDTRLGRDVALKTLLEAHAGDPERLARFEREARVVAALNHPNIVTLFELGEADGLRFIVMELVTGRPLTKLIPPAGCELKRLLELAVPIAQALAAAHERGVVHRDLKPSNVMITDDDRVKVLDFGLARLRPPRRDDESGVTVTGTLTIDRQMLGTVPYMAPEQLRGEPADERSDLFALGVLLYEMATGERPFQGDSALTLAASILQREPPSVERRKPGLHPRFGRIVRRCMEKDPRRRAQSALDVADELQGLAEELAAGAVSIPSGETTATAVPLRADRSRARFWPLWGAGTLVLVIAGVALWLGGDAMRPTRPPTPTEATVDTLAVLPFDNLMNDPQQGYFVDGMHEALITELAKLGTLRVTSRSSVMRYKGQRDNLRHVARELGVDALVEGSVLRAGDRVRITAQLIRGDTDEHVWAESYDGDLRDVLALLDEVSRSIAQEIGRTLGHGAKPPPLREQGIARVDPRAYDAYLRARDVLNVSAERGAITEALVWYERAAEIDPGFAGAWGGIALMCVWGPFFGEARAEYALPRARETARRALELDDRSGDAWTAIGLMNLYYDWDFHAAETVLLRALELSPHDVMARHAYADHLMIAGRREESLEQVRLALRDNPDNAVAQAVVCFHTFIARHYAEALDASRKALAEHPDSELVRLRWVIFRVLWLQGRYDEALAEFRLWSGEQSEASRTFESAFHASGPLAAMRAVADLWAGSRGDGQGGGITIAALYAAAGEVDSAFDWLERAFETRHPALLHVPVDPMFDGLREDARFADLMRRVGLPEETWR